MPPENSLMNVRSKICEQIKLVAQEQDQRLGPLSDELPLLDLGLDSLSFAILVSRLEAVLGVDPFSESDDAPFPVNLGDFIRFYENAVQQVA
jgi:acyl carrier protein